MDVKRKTFYHLSLSLPYLALLIAGGFLYFVEGPDFFYAPGLGASILSSILAFFTVSAVLWAPLYTWMVAVMLFWGRGKTAGEVRTLCLLSPFLLACATGFPALFVGLPHTGRFLLWGILHLHNLHYVMPVLFETNLMADYFSIGLAWAFMAALCIVIGYAFVGCALLIERTMNRRGLFLEEEIMKSGSETGVTRA